jgi:hypothetical protein
MLQVLMPQRPVVNVLEVDLVPPGRFVAAGTEITSDGKRIVAQELFIDANLAVAALLVRVVRLLGTEVLEEQPDVTAVAAADRQHLGRE